MMANDDQQTDRRDHLEIYLQDHRAGAEAGVRLAQRCTDHAPTDATKRLLEALTAEIVEDRNSLDAVMSGLGVRPSSLKMAAGVAGERLGRLKLNGRFVRTSPLSIVVEIEGLIGAVSVKRELWATLTTLASAEEPDERLEDLRRRAEDQRTRLQALHSLAVDELFGLGEAPAAAAAASPLAPEGSPR
jgi:hypothetical protein